MSQADYVPPKPPPDAFAPPVAWLLGPEIVGAIKRLALYALYRGELDLRDWMAPRAERYEAEGELWFDFISDVGDGQRAMYTTALLCQDDLHVDAGGAALLPAVVGAAPPGATTLPRGAFLVVGGDAAYPIADAIQLEARFRHPFVWARRDLVAARRPAREVDLYGVPSNHDYYDQLTGWNRLFRAPVTGEGVPGPSGVRPPLSMPGFRRRQTASYFALRLPWDWQLWALDPGEAGIDLRQEWFFREQGSPEKLILVTPSPMVAQGRVVAERAHLRSLERLGLPEGGCRLDLSGDMHHYARYATADEAPRMAVVAGAGGAFHHPTFQEAGEVPVRALYPDPEASRREVMGALFRPWTIWRGGGIGVVAFLVAVLVAAGSLLAGTRAFSDTLLGWLGVTAERSWPTGGEVAALPTAAWAPLAGAALVSAGLVAAIALLILAARYARWVTRALRRPRAEWSRLVRALALDRLFLPSWILVAVAAALPAVVPLARPTPAPLLVFQLGYLWVVVGIGVGLVVFAVWVGAERLPRRGRAILLLIGAGHALFQLALPLVVVRVGLARPAAAAAAFAAVAVLAVGGRACLLRDARWLAMAVWLAHAAVVVAIVASGGVAVSPRSAGDVALFLAAAGVVGSLLGCLEYGWYLAVAAAFGGHNNEVGAAARSERFRQLIRFRLEPDRLTGHVIAVDDPGTTPAAIRARVVDVFTVARPES